MIMFQNTPTGFVCPSVRKYSPVSVFWNLRVEESGEDEGPVLWHEMSVKSTSAKYIDR